MSLEASGEPYFHFRDCRESFKERRLIREGGLFTMSNENDMNVIFLVLLAEILRNQLII